MTLAPTRRLRKIPEIVRLIDALETSQPLEPTIISLVGAQRALQALYEVGAVPLIATTEPAFAWYWHRPDHDHWMIIEEAEDDAFAWVAPNNVWPHSKWLLQRMAGLERTELVVDRAWWGMTSNKYAATRKKRELLARWLSDHGHQLTHMAVFEGEALGLTRFGGHP